MVSEFLGLLGAGIGISYVARTIGRGSGQVDSRMGQTVGAVWGGATSGVTTYALGKAAGYYFAVRRQGKLR